MWYWWICVYHGKCFFFTEFVYYSNEPEVSSTDYGKVNVTFDPKMVSGYGTPKLYQIQYSEKVSEINTNHIIYNEI